MVVSGWAEGEVSGWDEEVVMGRVLDVLFCSISLFVVPIVAGSEVEVAEVVCNSDVV